MNNTITKQLKFLALGKRHRDAIFARIQRLVEGVKDEAVSDEMRLNRAFQLREIAEACMAAETVVFSTLKGDPKTLIAEYKKFRKDRHTEASEAGERSTTARKVDHTSPQTPENDVERPD